MKKALIIIISVLLALAIAAGIFGWVSYNNVTEDVVPEVQVTVNGQTAAANQYSWTQPVLFGLMEKGFAGGSGAHQVLPEMQPGALTLGLPQNVQTVLVLSRQGTQVYNGDAVNFDPASVTDPGTYALGIECVYPQDGPSGYGSFEFIFSFSIPEPEPEPEPEPAAVEPALIPGTQTLQQGDIFSMQVVGLPEDVTPTATTDLGFAIFTPMGEGVWYATVPIGNSRAVGDYAVQVQAGEHLWDVTVTVEKFDFVEQNLEIDTSDPVISEANSDAAYAEWNNKVYPLFSTWDEERYWDGLFIQPVEGGYISTEFGTIRYTNGDYSTSRSHHGMDFAVGEGTPIKAPNHGRVVLAEYLLNTGWTIVIEHGGGLKSLYYHMIEIYVEPDTMVTQGDIIGAVGTTGYSTGNHLHYETRIGKEPVSPSMMFDGTAGIYSAMEEIV